MSTRWAMSGLPNTRHMLISPNPSVALLLLLFLKLSLEEDLSVDEVEPFPVCACMHVCV